MAASPRSCRCRGAGRPPTRPMARGWRMSRCAARSTCGSATAAATPRPIWLATLTDSKVEKVPRENSNDYNPLWLAGKVYFLSDRNGAGLPLLLRHAGEAGEGRSEEQQRLRLQVDRRYGRRDRRRAVRRTGAVRSEDRHAETGPGAHRWRFAGSPRPNGQRQRAAVERAPVAERDARAVRGAR